MKLGMRINYAGDFRETVAKLADFEAAGLDRVIVPEVYDFDAAKWVTSQRKQPTSHGRPVKLLCFDHG